MRFQFLLAVLIVPAFANANSEYCLIRYKSDFSFSKKEYVVDMPNGLTAEVHWGPHGYGGSILQPQVGDQQRVPVERFETFYQALNCQRDYTDIVWREFTQLFTKRKDCKALVYGSKEASFQCGYMSELFWLGEDVLGAFQKYESKSTGIWYQSTEYAAAKQELELLASRALEDAYSAVVDAASISKCGTDVDPERIEIPEKDVHWPIYQPGTVMGSISFTVSTDGFVSEILGDQSAEYYFEYIMAYAARKFGFPKQDKKCRATWRHTFD